MRVPNGWCGVPSIGLRTFGKDAGSMMLPTLNGLQCCAIQHWSYYDN